MANKNKTTAPQEEEMAPDLLTLEDEDGVLVTFEIIDNLDYTGVHYMAAVEYVEDEDDIDEDAQLILFKMLEDEDGAYYDIVEDDEELLAVSKLFEKRLADWYEIQK